MGVRYLRKDQTEAVNGSSIEWRFEEFLEEISKCFDQQDVEVWLTRLILPFSIITPTGPVLIDTEKAVAKNFNLYLQAMDILNIEMVCRNIISLEDCRDGTWLGTFQTRLLSSGILVTAPYTSTALLQLKDKEFRMSSMLNGRGHSEWTGVNDR